MMLLMLMLCLIVLEYFFIQTHRLYLLVVVLISIHNYFNVVVARGQKCMKVASRCSKDSQSSI